MRLKHGSCLGTKWTFSNYFLNLFIGFLWHCSWWLLTCLLAYLFCGTFPRFPRVGLFMAVFNTFFHWVQSCAMFGSIFHARRSSFTDSFHVFRRLPLPWQPTASTWVQLFTHSSLLSTCPYHIRQFILSLDFKCGRLNHEYKLYRLTCSSTFTSMN